MVSSNLLETGIWKSSDMAPTVLLSTQCFAFRSPMVLKQGKEKICAFSIQEVRRSPVHREVSPLQDAGVSICHLLMTITLT